LLPPEGVSLEYSAPSLSSPERFRFRPRRIDEISPNWRRRISPELGFSLRLFFSSASVRSSKRACASAASLASSAALWLVVSLIMRPRNRVLGFALLAGLRGRC
jgi:hypothetical protein